MKQRDWVGWRRSVRKEALWQRCCEAASEAACWALLLAAPPLEGGHRRTMVVLPAGEHPKQALRVTRPPRGTAADLRAARTKTGRRGGAPPSDSF